LKKIKELKSNLVETVTFYSGGQWMIWIIQYALAYPLSVWLEGRKLKGKKIAEIDEWI
jgi:hypothetical protein